VTSLKLVLLFFKSTDNVILTKIYTEIIPLAFILILVKNTLLLKNVPDKKLNKILKYIAMRS
jgi:hypothetical protein